MLPLLCSVAVVVVMTHDLISSLVVLAPVIQRADNFIQEISRYPVDKAYWLEYILSAR